MNIRPFLRLRATSALVVSLSAAYAGAAEQPPSPPEPSIKHVDAKQAQQLIAEKKVVVLDLRTPKEYNSGHIAGATNIDFRASDFEQHINRLDKTKSYMVHCAAGGRSSASLPVFKKQQFQSIYHLDGGIKAWEKAGLPIEK